MYCDIYNVDSFGEALSMPLYSQGSMCTLR